MEKLSKIGETLLEEIIKTNADVYHWNQYFDDLFFSEGEKKYINESILRSAFDELKDKGLINVSWAENKPYYLKLTSQAYSYVNSTKSNIVDWIRNNAISILALIVSIIALFRK